MAKISVDKHKKLMSLCSSLDEDDKYIESIVLNNGPNLYGAIWDDIEIRTSLVEKLNYDKTLLSEFLSDLSQYGEQ